VLVSAELQPANPMKIKATSEVGRESHDGVRICMPMR
jgi:hypothetical protein